MTIKEFKRNLQFLFLNECNSIAYKYNWYHMHHRYTNKSTVFSRSHWKQYGKITHILDKYDSSQGITYNPIVIQIVFQIRIIVCNMISISRIVFLNHVNTLIAHILKQRQFIQSILLCTVKIYSGLLTLHNSLKISALPLSN